MPTTKLVAGVLIVAVMIDSTDACPDHVVMLLGEKDGVSHLVIQEMAEKSYRKRPKPSSSSSSASIAERYNFKDNAWETTGNYQLHALAQLMRDFPFLYKDCVKRTLAQQNNHYYHTKQALELLTGCTAGNPPADLKSVTCFADWEGGGGCVVGVF